jgi:hypothetical protein
MMVLVLLGALNHPNTQVIAMAAPTLTIFNEASENVLVHIVGPSDAYVPVGAMSSRYTMLSTGRYEVFLRWGNGPYRYSRLDRVLDADENYRYSLTLRSLEGNTEEDPSSEAEFNGRR